MQSLQQVIADVPTVDVERIASLKAAIADGSYSVNADQLAQNLLGSELQFR
ncbi:MAG: flagellar biosynthesis anti-sigma factor FlgM [Gammaproteobacteria bacterium]|nr:flagellar biosynthesis anti-sigma factor FlgM [Gammaproteobacteria bacterium]